MDQNTEVDLDALHAAIVADIQAQFPDLQTVEFYREERDGAALPACFLELVEFENAGEDADPQTGQLAVVARFEAEIIMGFRVPNVKLEMRKLAAAFAAWLRLRRWSGVVTGAANVVGCYRDEFNPRQDQYEVWRVEWNQVLHIGQTVWTNEGTVPTTVMASWFPDVGTANADDYRDVAEGGAAMPNSP